MPKYLVSYRPICLEPAGKRAIQIYDIPKYVDATCRREPNLESSARSITSICRRGKFAPRLHVGDGIAYMTLSRRYEGLRINHHRLTAMLEVVHRFESHEETEKWYWTQGTELPGKL